MGLGLGLGLGVGLVALMSTEAALMVTLIAEGATPG